MKRRVLAIAVACASLVPARLGAQDTTGAAGQPLPRGVVIERVACAAAPDQSYALYLPSSYSAERPWPILYAFDPGGRGDRPVRLALEAAERFGWIVAGSNNSRNGPTAEIQVAVAALTKDTVSRFAIDPRRIYATGLSGGARVATSLALGCRGCVAGVFAQAAGLPSGLSNAPAIDFAWFASAGERDMNYGELFLLEQELQKRAARQRLRVFDGGHEWAPPAVWSEALEWFELLAMNDGRRPRDTALTALLFEKASARAAALRDQGQLLDEQRELAAIARDFEGWSDTAPARSRAQELAASAVYRKALERERELVSEQSAVASPLYLDLARLAQAPSEDRAEILLRATREASGLARGLASAKEPGRRLVYERARSQAYIEAMETARGLLRRKQADSALELFEIAAALRPDLPTPQLGRAQALAAAGRKQDAVRALRRAVELGLAPSELSRLLETNDAFAKLRDEPDVRALLAAPRQP